MYKWPQTNTTAGCSSSSQQRTLPRGRKMGRLHPERFISPQGEISSAKIKEERIRESECHTCSAQTFSRHTPFPRQTHVASRALNERDSEHICFKAVVRWEWPICGDYSSVLLIRHIRSPSAARAWKCFLRINLLNPLFLSPYQS